MDEKSRYFLPTLSKNETTSVASLFEARKFYKNSSIPYAVGEHAAIIRDDETLATSANSPQGIKSNFIPTSDLYNQTSFYGIIDDQGDVVIPIPNMLNFKQVGINSDGEQLYLQDFIADAFKDMVNYLNRQILKNCYALGGLAEEVKNSPFYNLTVKKSYTKSTDINKLYIANSEIIALKFKNSVIGNNLLDSSITDYRSFNKKYINFLKDHMIISPVTKSRTACFYNFRTFSNGLTFSFSEDDASNDEKKYEKYYMDPGFYSFSQACLKFGFRMDENIPFILHVDLNSPALTPYLKKYSLNTVSDVFKKRFTKVFKDDIRALKYFFIDSYNIFIENNDYYTSNINNYCSEESKFISTRIRYPINNNNLEQYFQDFPDVYWLRLYTYLKSEELQLDISQSEFDVLVNTAAKYIKFGRLNKSMEIINSKFNELTGVKYFSSLLQKNEVVQLVRSSRQEIKF